jgi:hypothetical protein
VRWLRDPLVYVLETSSKVIDVALSTGHVFAEPTRAAC